MKTIRIAQNSETEHPDRGIKGEAQGFRVKKKARVNRILYPFLAIFLVCTCSALLLQMSINGESSIINSVGAQIIGNFTNPDSIVNKVWAPEIKNDGRFSSALIIGLDTREVYYDGENFHAQVSKPDGDRNTDSIMQIIYDHQYDEVFMISFPRDMGVDVSMACMEYHERINGVYDIAERNNCEGGGVAVLSSVVEGITGVEVHYYGVVTLEGFEKIINTVGELNDQGVRGVYVDVEEELYEAYPNDYNGYDHVYFPAGRQFLSAHQALQYARSRQQTSDFHRARRQQVVMEAVKDRVVSSQTLTDPQRVMDLIDIFKSDMQFSNFGLDEVRSGVIIAQNLNSSKIHHVVLDPEFGGDHNKYIKKYVSRPNGYYYMSPVHWQDCGDDDAFCQVRYLLEEGYDNPNSGFWE